MVPAEVSSEVVIVYCAYTSSSIAGSTLNALVLAGAAIGSCKPIAAGGTFTGDAADGGTAADPSRGTAAGGAFTGDAADGGTAAGRPSRGTAAGGAFTGDAADGGTAAGGCATEDCGPVTYGDAGSGGAPTDPDATGDDTVVESPSRHGVVAIAVPGTSA
jgi:hypothetical protein